MTLTLDLPPELETRLQVAAARHGQDVKTFATAALTQASDEASLLAHHGSLTTTELESALDELAAIGAHAPVPAGQYTHRREDIYFDHD